MQSLNQKQQSVLQSLLANSYCLLLKTQNYHWNIASKTFYSLHLLLEKQYQELFESIDKIAETIRTFDIKAIAGLTKYQKLTFVKDGFEDSSAGDMITDLYKDHQQMINILEEDYGQVEKNIVCADLLTQRLAFHRQAVWMLKATI